MRSGAALARLLVVTDRHGADRPLFETIRAAVEGGARFIWLRDRDLDRGVRAGLARDLIDLLRPVDGTLVVGGDADLAAQAGAQGVHLSGSAGSAGIRLARETLGPAALIGVSAHSVPEVEAAAGAGADYATLSPVYASSSKPGYGPALGPTVFRAAARCHLPVFGLGGIEPGNARACLEAGAAGIAVMGGLMRAADPCSATALYRAALA